MNLSYWELVVLVFEFCPLGMMHQHARESLLITFTQESLSYPKLYNLDFD